MQISPLFDLIAPFAISSNFLVYLFNTLLGRFGPAEYYQLGAITITVIPPISANRLLINMYESAHAEQPTWTEGSVTKPHHQVRNALRCVFSLTLRHVI